MRTDDEPLLREVNHRIHALTRNFTGPGEYLCECGNVTCQVTLLALDASAFADVLATPGGLLVAPGHDPPGTELVSQGRGYLVVRATE
jgi:hypothetical protein